MSQRNVERVIGRLVTDEAFRRRFATYPDAALAAVGAEGLELNDCERRALAAIDAEAIDRFASAIDARLHKTDLHHWGCP